MKSKKKSSDKNIRYALIVLSAAVILFVLPVASQTGQFEWGTGIDAVKQSLGGEASYKQFTPKQKPDYDNKIVNYITAVDETVIDRIVVLRTNSYPAIDYLFVNGKLYTSLEEWGDIESSKYSALKGKLDQTYGVPSLQQEGSVSVYSYSDSKTKVIFYSKKSGSKYSCRVYYYAKQLFRLLIRE